MAVIDKFFKALKEQGGSDLHLQAGQPPKFRVHGRLEPLNMPPLSNKEAEKILFEILDDKKRARFLDNMDLDFAYEVPGVARFRCNYLRHQNGVGAVFRIIPTKIKTLEDLGVPQVLTRFCELRSGLVLVTGPTGSGKSTTLAAMIDYINQNQAKHMITIEDPIEFMLAPARCQVTQREVGLHTESFESALRGAMREDPDVIVIGDLRDYTTARLAIAAAETGHLVLASMPSNSAAKTLDKLLDMFPAAEQAVVRTTVSESLRGILSQRLVPGAKGRPVLAVELLFNSTAIANIIREGKTSALKNAMQTGRSQGMRTLQVSLDELVARGEVTPEVAAETLTS